MVHPWNKICLVSAIALAGAAFFFAGCTADNMRWIYNDITDATSTKNVGCACSYYQYGKEYNVNFAPNEVYRNDCEAKQWELILKFGVESNASCWPK